ncbi:MAG TPA: methyltransferase domain-containing protein [Edaphocola sp.]|nr:methyltransferase domain-containing protein [Edaphocola sp.]
MDAAYLDLLVHPVSKEKLKYNDAGNYLTTGGDAGQFPVIKNVPVLLSHNTGKEGNFNYQEHYEKDAEAYDYFADWEDGQQEESRRLRQHILREIPKQAKWVLDVGCGGGWLAKALCAGKQRVISTDISTKNPIKAVENIPAPTHFGLVADVFALPLKENSIDCIVSSEVIEHVPDPKAFIVALYKVLSPGGTLIITTPYNEKIQQSLCIHCNHLTPHNAHLHSFTRQKIESLIPAEAVGVRTSICNSKALVILRLHLLLRFLPFSLWNIADKIMLKLSRKKALRLILVLQKKTH